jgi:predicted dehydrogenase
MEKIHFGIVGAGLIWKDVHEAIFKSRQETIEITGFCAHSPEGCKKFIEEYPNVKVFNSYDDMLLSPDIDAVLILTPILLNGPYAYAALRAGKSVFVEKPFASSIREAEDLIDLEEKTGKNIYILEQAVYSPKFIKLQELIKEGAIGKIVHYDSVEHWYSDPDTDPEGSYSRTKWRIESEFPLGTMFDGGIHHISMLSKLFGQMDLAFAMGSKHRYNTGGYDHIVTMFEHGDISGTYSHSSFLGCENYNYFHIWGTEGVISVESEIILEKKLEGNREVFHIEGDSSHKCMWTQLLESYVKGDKPFYKSTDALSDIKALIAVDKSLKSKATIQY